MCGQGYAQRVVQLGSGNLRDLNKGQVWADLLAEVKAAFSDDRAAQELTVVSLKNKKNNMLRDHRAKRGARLRALCRT